MLQEACNIFFDALVFLNARFDTRVSVFKTRVFAHLRTQDRFDMKSCVYADQD